MTRRGKFITFEGPEGGGKSTQIRHLARRLEQAGLEVLLTREPGGTATGELVREILQHDRAGEPICPETETLLFEACRAQLVRRVIRPALDRGAWVLCDRFADSTTAYQGFARGFPIPTVLALNRFAMGVTRPDLTILLDLPVRAGMRRLKGRSGEAGPDRIEREATAFHERVRRGYRILARRWPKRFRVIRAGQSVDRVSARVWEVVRDEFGLQG